MSEPFKIGLDNIIGPMTHISQFTYWDKALEILRAIDEQYSLNCREKLCSRLLMQCYEFPESEVYYYEQSIMGPDHPWMKGLIAEKILFCPTSETHHFTEPDANPLTGELPVFYHVGPQTYEIKKKLEPNGKTFVIFETWPVYTRYSLKITKRTERNIDRILNTESIKDALDVDSTDLSDAISIEIPFGIGKVNVLKLWEWLKK